MDILKSLTSGVRAATRAGVAPLSTVGVDRLLPLLRLLLVLLGLLGLLLRLPLSLP